MKSVSQRFAQAKIGSPKSSRRIECLPIPHMMHGIGQARHEGSKLHHNDFRALGRAPRDDTKTTLRNQIDATLVNEGIRAPSLTPHTFQLSRGIARAHGLHPRGPRRILHPKRQPSHHICRKFQHHQRPFTAAPLQSSVTPPHKTAHPCPALSPGCTWAPPTSPTPSPPRKTTPSPPAAAPAPHTPAGPLPCAARHAPATTA